MRQLFVVLCVAVAITSARWTRRARFAQPTESSFVGETTNEISTALFQGYLDDDKNLAFSPLGYSAILAILAEGAAGDTKKQLSSALHLPSDQALTRNTYRQIMERLKNTNAYKFNQPELKNWFYIYKNYTINEDFKKILEDYYLTEVRTVERYTPYDPTKDDEDDDDEKVPPKPEDTKYEEYKPSESQKNEEVVDLLPPKESDDKFISFAVEDKPEKLEVPSFAYKPAKNIKEKIKLVKTFAQKKGETLDDEETMVAVEARNHGRSLRVLSEKHDISSSLSVNSVGKACKSAENSLMIMFNGMYFRGAWKKPFEKEEPALFYKSWAEKKLVPTMKTRGVFKTGAVVGVNSQAIELPYDGGRYTLLVVMPNSRDGLNELVAVLPSIRLSELLENLEEETVDVSLPSFYIETTTKPVASLAKFGVSSIFMPSADLSGISPVEGLFVQEMVQHVAVRVDNAGVTASQITADTLVQSLKSAPVDDVVPVKKFSAEHPFIFFIHDRIDNLVVVAGKVTDPQQASAF